MNCYYCNRPIRPGQGIFRLHDLWTYDKFLCALLDCLEAGHTIEEVVKWNDSLDLYYTELEEIDE